jgi:hypothetical protein
MRKAGETLKEDGLDTPSYEEIVQILTFLVDVVDVKVSQTDARPVRDLQTWLHASLDAALRLEWNSRMGDENGEVLYLD